MNARLSDRSTSGLLTRCATALLLFPLSAPLPAPAQKIQQNGVAIWELPRPQMTALLTSIPPTDAARYDRLRRYFVDFGCTGASLEEQRIDKKGRHRNLVCTLPGLDKQRIVVTAWYPDRRTYGGGSHGWPDAVMLPILYNALVAEPHHYTLVFAALDGSEGEYHFFRSMHKADAQPLVLVALHALGFTSPTFFATPAQGMRASSRATAKTVFDTALTVAQFQGLANDPRTIALNYFLNPAISANSVSGDLKDVPRISIASAAATDVSFDAFRQGHDFIAFFLGGLDIKLATPPTPPAAPPK